MANVKHSICRWMYRSSEKIGMSLRTLQRGNETSSGLRVMDRVSTGGQEAEHFRNWEDTSKEARSLKSIFRGHEFSGVAGIEPSQGEEAPANSLLSRHTRQPLCL